MSALGKVSEAAGTQPAASGTATGATAAATQTPAKATDVMAHTLFNRPAKIFYQLARAHMPPLKPNYVALFYAIDRILTNEQRVSAVGKRYTQKKAEIESFDNAAADASHLRAAHLQKVNERFLKEDGLDPKQVVTQFWQTANNALWSKLGSAMATMVASVSQQALLTNAPHHFSQVLNDYCCFQMIENYGLKTILFKEMASAEGLIKVLQTRGFLIVQGNYRDTTSNRAIEMGKIGKNVLFGWKKVVHAGKQVGNSSRDDNAVIVIGAEMSKQQSLVFWVDPAYWGDPKVEQRVFISSFTTFIGNVTSFYGQPLSMAPLKDDLPVAVCNPQFTAEAQTATAAAKK